LLCHRDGGKRAARAAAAKSRNTMSEAQAFLLPTGSIVSELGAPDWSEARYRDEPGGPVPRADAWFWSCGCLAEPVGPGRFSVHACDAHRERLAQRYERKQNYHRRAEGD